MRLVTLCAIAALSVVMASGSLLTAPNATFPVKAYGYVPINSTYDSAMFYALRGDATATQAQRATRPLVMFLQGGPGASSLFSDFLETGPVKVEQASTANPPYELTNRTHTWVKHANMLYVDNPVGTGFSYTKDPRGFSTSDDEIAANLIIFLQGFLNVHTEFKNAEFWVFCESYGGKMTAYYGAALMTVVKAGLVPINFKGVALGDGWVDPIGCMYSYAPYLQAFGQITADQVKNVTQLAQWAQDALERGDGVTATSYWGQQQNNIGVFTDNINWYNSLYYYDYTAENAWTDYMSTAFTAELGGIIPAGVYFNFQSNQVFTMMSNSFMRDGILQVQAMINGGISVNVYGGQVDLIVDTLCIQGWIDKLPWADLAAYRAAPRTPFSAPTAQNVAGFVQTYKNFAFWQINQAGHMVPLDQPWAAEHMFATIIGADTSKVPKDSGVKSVNGRSALHTRKRRMSKP